VISDSRTRIRELNPCPQGYTGATCEDCADDFSEYNGSCEVRFALPFLDPDGHWYRGLEIGVDHDWPDSQAGVASANNDDSLLKTQCRDYQDRRAPHCYDGHDGTDYELVGGFDMMDRGVAEVLAAAPGVVTTVVDGNYDRCHFSIWADAPYYIDCDGYEMAANKVFIDHADGTQTRYLHLKKDSVIVEEGDHVRCGQMLGLTGSSGISSGPHVHFEVRRDGLVVDPFSEDRWIELDGPHGLPSAECQ